MELIEKRCRTSGIRFRIIGIMTALDSIPATEKVGAQFSNTDFLKNLPAWFAVLAAMLYGFGYLIEFSFLRSMGVVDAGIDAFKAKYIYVGLLCIQFPVSLLIVTMGGRRLLDLRVAEGKIRAPVNDGVRGMASKPNPLAYASSVLMLLNFFIYSYLMVTFCNPEVFFRGRFILGSFLFCNIYVILLASMVEKTMQNAVGEDCAKNLIPGDCSVQASGKTEHLMVRRFVIFINRNRKKWNRLRFIICIAAMVITCLTFYSTLPQLWEMLRHGGIYCVVFALLTGMLITTTFWRIAEIQVHSARTIYMALGICLLGAFIYIAVLFFAYRVYPYIPVARGGGDFTAEDERVFTFDVKITNSLPRVLVDDAITSAFQSKPVIVLHETSTVVHVAFKWSTNGLCCEQTVIGPAEWRLPGITNKPAEVFTIRRDAIVGMHHKNLAGR